MSGAVGIGDGYAGYDDLERAGEESFARWSGKSTHLRPGFNPTTGDTIVDPESEWVPMALDLAALALTTPKAKRFVVERIAPAGEVTLCTGAGASGKSLFGQQLCTASAASLQCLRLDVAPGPAIYLSCEDDADQLHWRQAHICDALGVPMATLAERLYLISLRGELGNDLCTFDNDGRIIPSAMFRRLTELAEATSASLIVLDNVAHLFAENENDRGKVTRFVNLLNRLAGRTGAAIILVGHPNKSGDDYSGSTAWLNAVRSHFTIDHDRETDVRTLKLGKANYSRQGEAVRFVWCDWAFVLETDIPPDRARELRELSGANGDNALFLTCLRERTAQRRAVSENLSPTYAPTIFATMAESKRIGKVRLQQAMDRLFRMKALERAELWKGPDRKAVFGLRETAGNGAGDDAR